MSNKVYSPVVVENPIIPAISSHAVLFRENSTCRVSTSACSSVNASSNNYVHPVKSHTYHNFNGKELALQLDKLHFTSDDNDTKKHMNKGSTGYSSALTLKAVKQRPLKRAVHSKTNRGKQQGNKSSINAPKFVLKPSKLNRCVKTAFSRSYTDFYRNIPSSDIQTESKVEKELSVYHDFSEACSKELETIQWASSISNENLLRPRSSSLPAAGASALESVSSVSPSTSPNKIGNSSDVTQHSSARRSRRKHQSKADLKPSRNDTNENSVPIETRGATRANKRRKSPPGASMSSIKHSIDSLEDERDKSHDNLDASIDRLADYLEDSILLPKKMSYMAEMMYT